MASAALFLCAAASAFGATFTVTTTADSGPGSLRQAILAANASPGSRIVFSIGFGLQTIRPLTELPQLETGTIDGTTQPGYDPGYPHVPLIEIDGSLLPALSHGLKLGGGSPPAAIKALLVNRCPRAGIWAGGQVTVQGSWIGLDANGIVARPNGIGIHVVGSGATIGGGFGDRNVISGNSYAGILMNESANVIGNLIGTDIEATSAVPNLIAGVSVEYTSNVTIGGEGFNMISGNGQSGIMISYSSNVAILNNVIGPSAFLGPVGTQRVGVWVEQSSSVLIGGSSPNDIAFNADVGIGVDPASRRVEISRNFVHSNGFGIDLDFVLNPPGPRLTPNDAGDGDIGGNLLQNFPLLESAFSNFTSTTVRGSIHTNPSSALHLEFYATESCNVSGYGQGKWFLGAIQVETNSGGDASFVGVFPVSTPLGQVVTATATDSFGNTSEFSACVAVTEPPGQRFYTLTPCRLVDTRPSDTPLGAAPSSASTRTFALAGACGIPTSARSIAANVTVTQPAAAGYLTIYPADVQQPLASNINFTPGSTRAGNAILELSGEPSRSITVQNGSAGTVHLLLDVSGYFE